MFIIHLIQENISLAFTQRTSTSVSVDNQISDVLSGIK